MAAFRSITAERSHLSAVMRAEGKSWVKIAKDFRWRYGINARKALRWAHGYSQADVARMWCDRWPDEARTADNISQWERWPEAGYEPSLHVLDRLAEIYQCDVPDLVADRASFRHLDSANRVSVPVGQTEAVNRRELLVSAASAAAMVVGSSKLERLPVSAQANVDAGMIDHLIDARAALIRADAMVGPRSIAPSVCDQIATIENALGAARPRMRGQLFEVGALFAELAGWLFDDIGQIAVADHWTDRAFEWARAADSPGIEAYVLMRKAQRAAAAGDPALAVALGSAAAENCHASGRVRAAAYQHVAHGHALDGDESAMHQASDRAMHVLQGDSDLPGRYNLAIHCTPAYLYAQRGACLTKLGQPDRALTSFDEALARWPGTYPRERGLHLARQAVAAAQAHEPARSAVVGRQALDVARTTHSERTLAELRNTYTMLGALRSSDPEVEAFRHQYELAASALSPGIH